jgi:hypothetical protein
MKTKKKFDINRVREFCKLVNEGKLPIDALREINACQGYYTPLKQSGIFWKQKDGTYKAVERIYTERYILFNKNKSLYNKARATKTPTPKQSNLFNQPKPKQPIAQKVKPKQPQLNFIQRVVKSLFNL